MNIFLEYIIVFILVYVIYYFLTTKHYKKYDKKHIPVEAMYLKKIYNVNITKDKYKNFLYAYSFINAFIITTNYIILMYLLNGWVLRIIIGVILLILMIIICYGLLARYYLKKEGR